MIARARKVAGDLSEADQIATLNAHPRIGEDPARLSALSLSEQGAERLPELDRLNAEYEARFGFRFVVFVHGRSKAEVAEVLRERLQSGRREELEAGLEAVLAIAEDRLR